MMIDWKTTHSKMEKMGFSGEEIESLRRKVAEDPVMGLLEFLDEKERIGLHLLGELFGASLETNVPVRTMGMLLKHWRNPSITSNELDTK